MSLIITLLVALTINLVFVTSAFAYLDPNAGGIFLQVIVPIIFGTAAAVTVFWKRLLTKIKDVLGRSKKQ